MLLQSYVIYLKQNLKNIVKLLSLLQKKDREKCKNLKLFSMYKNVKCIMLLNIGILTCNKEELKEI